MYYIGIDFGGTNIKIGIANDNGKIIIQDSVKTLSKRHYSEIIKDMGNLCNDLIKKAGIGHSDINSIGIGSPGSIDSKNGIVKYANNLKWENVPIVSELKKYIDLPVYISNDANCAALGEALFGSGKGMKNIIFLTLGTGVGGGIIIDGKLFEGGDPAGAECGHLVIKMGGNKCSCGRRGCLEAYASATALIKSTKQAMKKNPDSAMWKYVNGNIKSVDGRTSFECAKKGDASALKVVDFYETCLAEGIASFINIFRPEAVLIGGGICAQGDYLIKPLQEKVNRLYYGGSINSPIPIKVATLKNDAGILGAVALCMNR